MDPDEEVRRGLARLHIGGPQAVDQEREGMGWADDAAAACKWAAVQEQLVGEGEAHSAQTRRV